MSCPARHQVRQHHRPRARALLPVAVVMVLAATVAHAVDLGTIGPTYPIAEPHLIEMIQRRLREKERSGELQRLMDEARDRSVAAVRQPAPVPGLQRTRMPRTYLVDPSFTLDRNIVDAQGRLLFPAGLRKNPLEVVSLSKRLLFFDARDAAQVASARELIARDSGKVKPILIGGLPMDLMKAWRMPVYFDQQGVLTRRFGIRQVPAVVSQEGMRLRVDEVAVR